MTVLDVAKGAAKKLSLEIPDELYGSNEREYVELRDQIEDAADKIAEGHDWQLFSRQATIAGDGSTVSHDLPSDYDRMLVKTQLWSDDLETPLTHITDLDEWLGLDVQSFDFVINAWTIYGGQIHIMPALATGVSIKYFYQSNLIVTPESGSNQTTFTEDTDVFRLDEDLLELGTVWLWKSAKGQAYAEEFESYEEKKERLVARDKGSRIIRIGRIRWPSDVQIAYPQVITSP